MRAADRLGAGTAFAAARNPRNLAKAQATGDMPLYDLVTLRLDDVVPTPLNPRRHFGSTDELLTLGQGLAETQLQPCVAVPAPVYLRVWPEHADMVGSVSYVLINGERRWRAARHAGLEKLDFTVRGDLAVIHDGDVQSARAKLLDAVLKENIDRKNFDPIEEARGVAALVAAYGDGVRAGQQLNRGKAWVSQRLTLLALPTALQDEVGAGRISIDDARWMGARAKKNPDLAGDDLLQLLQEHHHSRHDAKLTQTASATAEGFTAVNPDGDPPHEPGSDHASTGTTIGSTPLPSVPSPALPLPQSGSEATVADPPAPSATLEPSSASASDLLASTVRHEGGDDVSGPTHPVVPPQTERDSAVEAGRSSDDAAPAIVLRTATPEAIVDALVWELTPAALAQVTQLLQERRTTAAKP